MFWVVLLVLLPAYKADECHDLLRCPKTPFSSDSVMTYKYNEEEHKWDMKMSTSYLDHFCPYFEGIVECLNTRDYKCNNESKNLHQMMLSTYVPVCVTYRTEITGLIDPCFNDLQYQTQLLDCYDIAVRNKYVYDDCRAEENWATCTLNVLQQCSPENAQALPAVFQAAKPYICNI